MTQLKPFTLFFLLLFLNPNSLFAQTDTLKVAGPNLKDLSEYITYWVDSTESGNLETALQHLSKDDFKKWAPEPTLNLGINPYPLWWQLSVQNTDSVQHDFWWSIYTQADQILVYRRMDSLWQLTDTLTYKTHLNHKKIRTRFPVVPITLRTGECQKLLLKINNLHHTQNAFTDLTTPAHNLLWEKRFYLKIGFFIGGFLLFSLLSLMLHLFMKIKAFLFFSGYVFIVVIMLLHEELLLTVAPPEWMFVFIKDLHPLPLSLVALGFHYLTIALLLDAKKYSKKTLQYSFLINDITLIMGSIAVVMCAIFTEYFSFQNPSFILIWNLCIASVFIALGNTFLMITYLMNLKKKIVMGFAIAFLLIYFNTAGYFLNYAGILNYYTITYPNYFYWIVSFEFIIIGVLLAWRYNKTIRTNIKLLKEKNQIEELAHLRTLSVLEDERKQIARNLHDDLGTTISAVKLIVSNNYKQDQQLSEMINRATVEIKDFYKKIAGMGNELLTLKESLSLKVADAEKLSNIKIEYIFSGDEPVLEPPLKDSLLRIVTELLSNLVKHSKAKSATLQLMVEPKQLQLLIEDDGIGFDTRKNTNSMGIYNIYSRAERWGGNVYFSSNNNGTVCIVNIPLKNAVV